ncbi:MAG: hypothetical protein V3R16_02480 [Nitrospirales bacterium]
MKAFVVALVMALSGCAVSGALYSDTERQVLPYNLKGGETFCWGGVGFPVGEGLVGIKPVGWGTHECNASSPIDPQ